MNRFDITHFAWMDNGHEPIAYGELSLDDTALTVTLTALEVNPLARYTGGPKDPVCLDSCLEFFFSLNGSENYINLEMNAIGGYYCGFGSGRHGRTYPPVFTEDGAPKPLHYEDRWTVTAKLSVSLLCDLFGIERIETIDGNFYKCGDQTELPHYGMWSPVKTPTPDFHRPEYFARIEL